MSDNWIDYTAGNIIVKPSIYQNYIESLKNLIYSYALVYYICVQEICTSLYNVPLILNTALTSRNNC